MVEDITETVTEEIIINAQPEFVQNSNEEVSANFFVLCEQNDEGLDKNLYEYKLLGVPMVNWVQRACLARPMTVKVQKNADIISLVRPYANSADYTVVLFANTPLVSSEHIKDLLAFVQRKNMNAMKLKKGYVFNNEYILSVDELYSADTYNFSTDDFFEVNSLADFEDAKYILNEKLVKFHAGNSVEFLGLNQNIDAGVQIGYASKICSGATLEGKTSLGVENTIRSAAIVVNSKLGDSVDVGEGSIIVNSIIKSGSKIGAGSIIKNSVIAPNANIGEGAKIADSALSENLIVGNFVVVTGTKVIENLNDGEVLTRKV